MSKIAIERILPNPEQPRKYFDPEEMESLAESVRANGVIEPIIVEAAGENYILHDGERRVRAAKMAELTEIEALVEPPLNGTGPRERLMRAVITNVQRADMNPIEEGKAYQRMMDEFGLNIQEICRRTGVPRYRIDHLLTLLEYEKEIQELIAKKRFTKDHDTAIELLKIPDAQVRVNLVKELAMKKVTLKGCKLAAQRTVQVLKEKEIIRNRVPSMALARERAKMEDEQPKRWNAMMELNVVPPWGMLVKVAFDTCEDCELKAMASHAVCGRCQLVDMLRRLLEAGR